MEKLKIGDSVWQMHKNKPTRWWVWHVNTEEYIENRGGYDRKINTRVTYGFSDREDSYSSMSWNAQHEEVETYAFKTKEELIASL